MVRETTIYFIIFAKVQLLKKK